MKTMKWGIIGAMPSEAELLKGQMEDLCEIKIGRLTFWEGLLCGQDAVIAVCRHRQGQRRHHRPDDDRPL